MAEYDDGERESFLSVFSFDLALSSALSLSLSLSLSMRDADKVVSRSVKNQRLTLFLHFPFEASRRSRSQ